MEDQEKLSGNFQELKIIKRDGKVEQMEGMDKEDRKTAINTQYRIPMKKKTIQHNTICNAAPANREGESKKKVGSTLNG